MALNTAFAVLPGLTIDTLPSGILDPTTDYVTGEEAISNALPAGYVGAMGSRRVHAERLDLLRAEGLTDSELARLRSPLGLDLGARTAEETAVSIAAELVAHLRGGTGAPLTGLDVAIHR